MYTKENPSDFTKQEIAIVLQVWNRAAISLLDIRHTLMSQGESLQDYRLPANAFLYTIGEKSAVSLDDTFYQTDKFGLFHGGKSTQLTIRPDGNWLEYYILFYKDEEPISHRREYHALLEQANPFRQQYGFMPHNPIFFAEELRKMYERWKGATPLHLFYGKSAFYRFVYEVYEELDKGQIAVIQPDIAAMAQRFIDRSYAQNISIRDMADLFHISYSHLHKSFTRQVGKSPQEYLIETRLNAGKEWLANSELSMREIAHGTGFSDEYHFNRMFVRRVGMTPGDFRKKRTIDRRDSAIGTVLPFPYNKKSHVSFDELEGKGALFMFKPLKTKSIVAAAMSFMLLLSACSTAPVISAGSESLASTTISQQASEDTKIVSTIMGDVEIPVNPKRVVVIFVQGDLLALGVTPVATSFNTGAAFEKDAQQVEVIDAFSINEEEIMALDPDLILWDTQDKSTYESLSKIAPTIANSYFAMGYQERLRFFGEIFDRSEKAEELITAFENKIETAKQTMAAQGISNKSVLCVEKREGVLAAFWLGRGAPLLYNLLDFHAPAKIQEEIDTGKHDGSVMLSYEVINQYAGDYILVNGSLADFGENELWKNLPAVKENRIIEAPANMFWFNDILSMNAQIDLILDSILEK